MGLPRSEIRSAEETRAIDDVFARIAAERARKQQQQQSDQQENETDGSESRSAEDRPDANRGNRS